MTQPSTLDQQRREVSKKLMEQVDWDYVNQLDDDEVDDDYIVALADDFEFYCAYEAQVKSIDGHLVYAALNDEQRKITKYALGELFAGRPLLLMILKPRQEGFSTWAALLLSWLTGFIDNYETMVIAHDDDATDTLLSKYDTIWQNASEDIRPDLDRSSRKLGIHWQNGSSVRIATAGTKAVASKKGRSKTLQAVHFSEPAFYDDADGLCSGVKSAIHLGPWKIIIFESTANGAAGYFYEQCKLAKEGKTDYKFWFVAWHSVLSNRIEPTKAEQAAWDKWRASGRKSDRIAGDFEEDEDGLIEDHNLDCGQWLWWGYTFRNVCDRDPERMRQEYPSDDISCFLSTGRPVFPHAQIEAQRKNCWEPDMVDLGVRGKEIVVDRSGDGQFMVWVEPEEDEFYIMSADVCEGSGGEDRAVIWLWKVLGRKLEMAAGYIGQPDPDELAQLMDALGRWYNCAIAAPEVNTYGQETVRKLRELGYPNIYREIGWDRAEGKLIQNRFGVRLTATNRLGIISSFKGLLRRGDVIIHCEELLDECSTFVFDAKSNKPQALSGKRDDCVSAAIIGSHVFQTDDDGQIVGGSSRDGHVVVDKWCGVAEISDLDDASDDVMDLEQELRNQGWA